MPPSILIMGDLEPPTIHNSGSLPVQMEGCENVRFKQLAFIESLTTEKIPPIDVHRRMQAVYWDKYDSLIFTTT
jgi:hypothetical protein